MVIRYARLFNLGNYENERIEVEETIGDGDSPEYTMKWLAEWVEQQGRELDERRRIARAAAEDKDIPF